MKCQVTTAKPRMFVTKKESLERRIWHQQTKGKILSADLKRSETEAIISTADHFSQLIDKILAVPSVWGARVYFAAYPNAGQLNVPAALENTLTLIYAPVKDYDGIIYDVTDKYYVMHPLNAPLELPKTAVGSWVRIEYAKKKKLLDPIFNLYKGDTNCILFTKTHLEEFKDEILGQDAKYVKAYFSSYLQNQNPIPGYACRMHVDYELLDANLNEFYIDDCPNFPQRAEPKPLSVDEDNKGFDNGSLCPPEDYCVGGGLLQP